MKTTARILVIDDDDHVREALVDELSQYYRVEAVASGGEAFDVLAANQYDVVISDLKMPDHDGIEVLDFARAHQRDAVRILLTGYLDERAQRALLAPHAPYKVGKPWHDEIEIVVRRGLEQRDLQRRLFASVEDALSLSTFDDELAKTRTPLELSELMVRRALTVEGVIACGAIVRADGVDHPFTGGAVPREGGGWYLDLPLDPEGALRLRARGVTESSREIIHYMAHRAQRTFGVLEARVATLPTPATGGGARLNQLMRQATLGALTGSLLHDLASTMQALTVALDDIQSFATNPDGDLQTAVAEAAAAGSEAVQLFVQMRKFIRDGEVQLKPVNVSKLVERAVKLAGPYVRERAKLKISELPAVSLAVTESLFLQVLANVLRNAANASPQGGTVDLAVRISDGEIHFSVTDDGTGVDPEIADTMFEPFASTTNGGTGLGLAISAYVMQMLEGRINYRKAAGRGACFTVTLPLRSI
ncbi:MAG TPA: ATP-binding protein [Kofleriaceae bacterium]|jgi:signal transduction histidine kinase